MILFEGDTPHLLLIITLALFGAALLTTVWRLLIGPSLPDRVVALDLLGILLVGLICVIAIISDQIALLSVALIAALILFMGTAAFAIYLERRGTS